MMLQTISGLQASLQSAEPCNLPDQIVGGDAFAEAHGILRKLQPPGRRASRQTNPTGFLGNAWYYVKKMFFFLFMNSSSTGSMGSYAGHSKLPKPLSNAVDFLDEAASVSNLDAIYTLADMSFYGKYGHPRNYTMALKYYETLAALSGNGTAQHLIGFVHSTGIGNVVEKDQAKALLYHTFAAEAGDTRAQMTAAYRHHSGIATPRNCEKAVEYYQRVADKAIDHIRSGPPGGHQLAKDSFRLADDNGGVYGEGASVSSSGFNAKQGGAGSGDQAAFDDVLEYLDIMSRKGELKATFALAKSYYDGSRALRQDYRTAKDFFLDIAKRYWSIKDGKVKPDTEPGLDKLASKAAGYIGRMYLRAEGVDQNLKYAKVWFRRGIENGDALSQYSLGLMHLYGIGVTEDPVKASEFFGAASDQDFSSAQVRLGALLMDQGDLQAATRYFELAQQKGHIEAVYYLAELNNQGVGRVRSCPQAALGYKIVAEKAEALHASFAEANDAYRAGDSDTALLHYMLAAEQGYEVAQANVAYLLEDKPRAYDAALAYIASWMPLSLTGSSADGVAKRLSDATATLALTYWTRSAKQANIDSLVKMGDYYLAGLGTPPLLSSQSLPPAGDAASAPDKAAACYAAAAETLQSAQAMWNLGWMHENGVGGVVQDFHLAKRYYDQSLETNSEAYLPVNLALIKLRLRSRWNAMVGGSVNSIRDDDGFDDDEEEDEALNDEGEPGEDGEAKRARKTGRRRKKSRSLSQWIADFLAADLERYANDEAEMAAAQRDPDGLDAIVGMGGEEWGRGGGGGDGQGLGDGRWLAPHLLRT